MAKKDVVEEVAVEEEVVVQQETVPTGTVKMTHSDGRVAFVKGCMITVYSRSGFKEE